MDQKAIPAFPVPLNPGQCWQSMAPCDGMTLRDYFAAKAIGGLMAMIATGKHDLSHLDGSTQEERLAVAGYRVADAMLSARTQ